jgi:hypothetical protein
MTPQTVATISRKLRYNEQRMDGKRHAGRTDQMP